MIPERGADAGILKRERRAFVFKAFWVLIVNGFYFQLNIVSHFLSGSLVKGLGFV